MPTESGGQSTRKRKAKTKNLCSFWKIALGSVALIYGAFVWSTVSSNRRLLEEFQRGLGDDETRSLMAALNNNTNDENSQQSEKKGGSQARPLPIVRIPENMNLQPKIKFKLYRGTVTDKQRDRKTSQNRTTSNSNKQQEQVEYFVHVSIKIPLEASQTWMSSLHSFFSSSLLSVVRTDASRNKGAVGYVESWYETALTRMEKTVTSNQKKNLVSCRRPSPSAASDESNPVSTSDSYMTHPLASCQSATIGDDLGGNGPFYYYNPLSNHARIVCGKSIPPKSTLVLNQLCEEPVTGRLFPAVPTPTGKDMPPIVTRFNKAYHAWRKTPQPEFASKINFTYTHGTCRTCRWAYARLYGLGWNHAQQRVEDLKILRRTCIHASTGLLQHPVVETWQTATSSSTHQLQAERRGKRISQSTNLHCLEGTLAQDQVTLALPSSKSVSLDRKLFHIVRQVDGVIDMQVHGFHNHIA